MDYVMNWQVYLPVYVPYSIGRSSTSGAAAAPGMCAMALVQRRAAKRRETRISLVLICKPPCIEEICNHKGEWKQDDCGCIWGCKTADESCK